MIIQDNHLTQGEAGDNMGALLRGIKRDEIRRGQVLAAPGTIKPVKKFIAQLYVRYYPLCVLKIMTYPLTDSDEGRRWSIYPFHAKLQASVLYSNC